MPRPWTPARPSSRSRRPARRATPSPRSRPSRRRAARHVDDLEHAIAALEPRSGPALAHLLRALGAAEVLHHRRVAHQLLEEREIALPHGTMRTAVTIAPRDDDEPRGGVERAAVEVAVAAGLVEAGAPQHGHELRRRVEADRERARVASAVLVDQRLGRLRDAGGGVEGALLEQQAALAEQPPVLLAEAAHGQVAMHGLDHQAPARAQDAADLGQRLDVLVVAVEAQRREEVQRGVEAVLGEGQLAVVGLDERRARGRRPGAGPRPAASASCRLR